MKPQKPDFTQIAKRKTLKLDKTGLQIETWKTETKKAAEENGLAVLRHWYPSRLVSNLLKYWQVVDLRFSIIWLEVAAQNDWLYTPPCSLYHFPPGRPPDETGLCWTDVKQGVWANPPPAGGDLRIVVSVARTFSLSADLMCVAAALALGRSSSLWRCNLAALGQCGGFAS